ncbi:hypothetical protein BDR05DRAFT_961746 [Suillus weaverae]|nr:hypothetical protein BDR05DRAFT_961746 [Suillus weaverae]
MYRYLHIGPGVLACPPRSTWTSKYHLTVRRAVPVKPRPHLVKPDGASVHNLYYHVKPQPCYTKHHSDWVKHFPTLVLSIIFTASILMSTSIPTYTASRHSELHAAIKA